MMKTVFSARVYSFKLIYLLLFVQDSGNRFAFLDRASAILRVSAALLLTLLLSSAASQPAEGRKLAAKLFAGVEEKFLGLQTLSYSAERITQSRRRKQKERWKFELKQPNNLRIEYLEPDYRLIVVSSNTVCEYIPEAGKSKKTNLSELGQGEREKIISNVMAHVSIDGIRLGNYETMLKRFISIQPLESDPNVYIVKGLSPKYTVAVDSARNVLLRTEIYNSEGKLIIRTEASDFLEIIPSFWFPQEIRITGRTKDGLVQRFVSLRNIHAERAGH